MLVPNPFLRTVILNWFHSGFMSLKYREQNMLSNQSYFTDQVTIKKNEKKRGYLYLKQMEFLTVDSTETDEKEGLNRDRISLINMWIDKMCEFIKECHRNL